MNLINRRNLITGLILGTCYSLLETKEAWGHTVAKSISEQQLNKPIEIEWTAPEDVLVMLTNKLPNAEVIESEKDSSLGFAPPIEPISVITYVVVGAFAMKILAKALIDISTDLKTSRYGGIIIDTRPEIVKVLHDINLPPKTIIIVKPDDTQVIQPSDKSDINDLLQTLATLPAKS